MPDIGEQLRKELSEFENSIDIVEPDNDSESVRYLSDENSEYKYNQLETLRKIDRYYLSQFDSGKYDSEGQRKTFLNIVKFAADVAAKQTDIDVKNYTFIPDDEAHTDQVWLLKRAFTHWTREHGYGQLLNDLNTDYSKYGTCVVKKVGKDLERVNLKSLKNTQDVETLQEAVNCGGFVIQEHKLSPAQMREFSDWDFEGLDLDEYEKYTVYERHALVPRSEIDGDEDAELVQAVAFVMLDEGNESEHIFFIEEEDQLPFEEAHWTKQDGRWLGIGEVENQFENQIARNLSANLRRRNMLWGAKKVFQSSDSDMVGKNLVREVADGEVLEVGPEGAISQVDMQTQHSVDFNSEDQVWDENSRQKSFMFEVNTGESMPSGTPFRLGVILSNASETHFDLKRENFGFFLERAFFNHLLPIFRKQMSNKEYTLSLASNTDGIERYQNAMLTQNANRKLKKKILDKNLTRNLETLDFNFDRALQQSKQELQDEPYFFLKAGKKAFDNIRFHMELTVTGEEIEVGKRIETLATLFQSLSPQDPRRERILNRIVSLTGMDPESFLKQDQQQKQQMSQENLLAGLTGNNADTTNTGGTPDLSSIGGGQQREGATSVLSASGG